MRKGKIFTEWFRGGRTNIAYNCLDRHIAEGRGDQTAILWEGNDPGHDRKMTYQEVLDDVCRLVRYFAYAEPALGSRIVYTALQLHHTRVLAATLSCRTCRT